MSFNYLRTPKFEYINLLKHRIFCKQGQAGAGDGEEREEEREL